MYIPAWFRNDDVAALHDLMRQYGFATLVSQTPHAAGEGSLNAAPPSLIASHLPFVLDEARGEWGTLRAHVARPNPQWQAFASGKDGREAREVLVIFQGPHAYISPSWYQKQPSVPTWNYAVVHAYGLPRLLSEEELRATLHDSVTFYEAAFEPPWTMDSLPDTLVDSMARGIVGFEIQITRLEGKFKLSQNRPPQHRAQVIARLSQSASQLDNLTAEWMQNTGELSTD